MFSWIQNATRSLSVLIEESINEEDLRGSSPPRREILTPLQAHLGLLKTKPKPLFHILPNELKLYIFSFLPPEDLLNSVSLVCREWRKLANDDESWKIRFYDEMNNWNVVGFNSLYPNDSEMPSVPPFLRSWHSHSVVDLNPGMIVPEKEPVMTWKTWYMQQYLQNSKSQQSPERALRRLKSPSNRPSFKFGRTSNRNSGVTHMMMFQTPTRVRGTKVDIYRIPIFGQGMESSASGLLYRLMWGRESPLFVTGLYPGVDGIGSGVGFKVNNTSLNLAAIYGDCSGDLAQWRDFFEAANGFIYVVDKLISDSQLLRAKAELSAVLNITEGVPLVVFACGVDGFREDNELPQPTQENLEVLIERSPSQIAENLGLVNLLSRRWCVRFAESLPDICKGLEWLSSELSS